MALQYWFDTALGPLLGHASRTGLVLVVAFAGVMGLATFFLRRQQASRGVPISTKRQEHSPAPTTDPSEGVRPKMLLDSIFLPMEKGVYFRSRKGTFTLGGNDTYALVTELVPRFVGKQTIEEICEDLAPEKREHARKLIATLFEKRIVINHVEEKTELSLAVREKFAAQIEFIEHLADNPLQRFAQFRASRILLSGSGIPLRTLALSLARNGLEKIILDNRSAEVQQDDEFRPLAKEFTSLGTPFEVERIPLNRVLAGESYSLDAICYTSDSADFRVMATINEYSCINRAHFLPAFLFGGKAFVGPLVRSGHAGCWMCALLRHSVCVEPELEARMWRHFALGQSWQNDGQPASSPSLRILGNLAGFELFRLFAGHLPVETDRSVLSIDLETLEHGTSRLLPHPNCPHCSKAQSDGDRVFLSEPNLNSAADSIDIPQKLKLIGPLVDAEFGIVRRFEDDELTQLPLFQSAVILSRIPGKHEVSIPGYSIQSNAGARLDALVNATRSYVPLLPNTSRLWVGTKTDALNSGLNPLLDGSLSNWLGGPMLSPGEATSWKYALSLGAGTMHLVNAGAVYSCTPLNTGGFEKIDVGIGLGFTFRQACGDAILSLFAHEVLKRAATQEVEFAEVGTDDLPGNNRDLQYLRNIFRHMDQPFRILEFSHEGSGRIVLAFSPNDAGEPQRITVGTASEFEPAAVIALTELLALALGNSSIRTIENYLPGSLGYVVDLTMSNRPIKFANHSKESNGQTMSSVLFAFGGSFADIIIANLTDEDIRQSNLIAVRALFVRAC